MGNERIISHWPARGGPVVWQDTVYYSGGIWPSDGVFLHALEAATGRSLWSNRESGGIFMAQPHGGAQAVSGVAPQGYLLATETSLIVPTGRAVKWQYRPAGSIRHNAVAIAGNRVYLIDRPIVEADRVIAPKRTGRAAPKLTPAQMPQGTLLAFDAPTGKELWRNAEDIYGTQLAVSTKHQVLLMNYKAVRHNFFEVPSEVGGRLTGIDLASGKRLWDQEANYQTRPLINDTTIYAQGGAWDLRTGSVLP